jgi:hypothetical protein
MGQVLTARHETFHCLRKSFRNRLFLVTTQNFQERNAFYRDKRTNIKMLYNIISSTIQFPTQNPLTSRPIPSILRRTKKNEKKKLNLNTTLRSNKKTI